MHKNIYVPAVFLFLTLAHSAAFGACPPNASPQYEANNVVHCRCNAGYENRGGACRPIPVMRAMPEPTMRAKEPTMHAKFKHTARGLIGGMLWEFGTYAMNVPQNLTGAEARHAREESERQFFARLKRAGIEREDFIDPKQYDFIIGVAASSNWVKDLTMRVFWDNLAKGRATPVLQREYNLLRGRSFDVLDCHSNGAMLCLSAIANGDIELTGTGPVRLMGPQITFSALQEWERLSKKNNFKLEIYYNNGDPVPRASYASLELLPSKHSVAERVMSAPSILKEAFSGTGLQEMIAKNAPSAKIVTSACDRHGFFRYSLACHSLQWYQSHYPH
jgi:hypothetical protein